LIETFEKFFNTNKRPPGSGWTLLVSQGKFANFKRAVNVFDKCPDNASTFF
jgi:hypothetical protein